MGQGSSVQPDSLACSCSKDKKTWNQICFVFYFKRHREEGFLEKWPR